MLLLKNAIFVPKITGTLTVWIGSPAALLWEKIELTMFGFSANEDCDNSSIPEVSWFP